VANSRISTDYSGRKIDLLAMDVDASLTDKVQQVPLSFGREQRSIAGVQQAAQAFVSLLLTKRGSVRGIDLGTDFLVYMVTRNPRTEAEVRNYFQLTAPIASQQVNQTAELSDERIRAVTLISAEVALDRISMRIQVTTEAGETAVVLAPIGGV
jgi:hypothetical protein